MSIHRRAAKRDRNEAEIVDALLRGGCSVSRLSGEGLPDLLVGRANQNYLLEVKRPDRADDLRDAQVEWFLRWRGSACVVTKIDEALKAVGLLEP